MEIDNPSRCHVRSGMAEMRQGTYKSHKIGDGGSGWAFGVDTIARRIATYKEVTVLNF